MKDGAMLINVSRGGIVDEAALIEALRAGKLFGAALYVFNREPPSGDDPLVASHFPNLILTPHVAWNSREAKLKNDQTFCGQIDCLVSGRLPEGIVNREIAEQWQERYGLNCEERKPDA
jgi:phosphoglycerate dehydrogenase-like enzyme